MVRKYTIVNNKLRFVLLAIILFFGVLQGYSQCPTADAGSDQEMCSNDAQILLDGTATYDSIISWETTGTGIITNGNTADPIYAPSSSDISGGSVILTMTVYQKLSLCPFGTNPATSSMRLTIEPEPSANAGDDQTICETDNASLFASARNYSAISWSSSGDGTFSDNSSLTAIYYPSVTDISAGGVILTLNVRLSKNLYFQALLTATNNLSTKQDLSQDLFVNFSVYSYFRGIKPSIL